jgi:predicted RNase H-like nuclease (RuvC/YqgF family)
MDVIHSFHMAARETGLKELGEMLEHVVKHMATKEDIANLTEHVVSIEQELKSVRRNLDDLRNKVENVVGYRKEIDHALERIAAIEKHLNLRKKMAA